MGIIDGVFALLFGNGRNVLRDTAEIFVENAEAGAKRGHDRETATLQQFAAEFAQPRKGWFERFIDGLNRVPRPAMALGVLGLFVAAMFDPIWFASRMQGSHWCQSRCGGFWGRLSAFTLGQGISKKGRTFNALLRRLWRMPRW